ncbi:MAG: OPT/YSL family transporter [Planctomycetaceae bacterium]|nr:OPT/YSL family transporter [Planctomycetaceae bacterium]
MSNMKPIGKERPGGVKIKRGEYPELTWTAIMVGWGLGTLITISVAYAALVVGFSIEGSELAAILGWGVLRGIMKRTSIVENNINQTAASAVNGASAGIMFTVPALFILSRTEGLSSVADFTPSLIAILTLASITGCFLGIAFVVPLRKQMIDFDRLAYPGGVAVATILKSPGAGIRKALLLFLGILLAGTVKLVLHYFELEKFDLGAAAGIPSMWNLVFYLSLMTVGVGYLSGRGGLWFGAGGFLCYFVIAPILRLEMIGSPGVQAILPTPDDMRKNLFLPSGIGMLIGAALGGIIMAFPLIRSAFKSLRQSNQRFGGTQTNDEMPLALLYAAVGLGAVAMIVIAYLSVSEMTLPRAIGMAVLGTLWIWVAGVIVSECVGRTNWSPLSGMTLISVTLLIVIAKAGMSAPAAVVSSIVVGAAICMAISQSSDMMLDLKSGYLTGAIPKRQQYAQYLGSWLGPLLVIMLMIALNQQYQIGSEALAAPQATALATVMDGILNDNVPVYRYVAGSGLGFLLATSGLGGIGVLVALGFYMPFYIVLTYTIGNLLRMASDAAFGGEFAHRVGIPVAAGLMIGEALVDIGVTFVAIGINVVGGLG